MSGMLLVDVLGAEATAMAETVASWNGGHEAVTLGPLCEHILQFAETARGTVDDTLRLLHAGKVADPSSVGEAVLALLANIEGLLVRTKPIFVAGGIPEQRLLQTRDSLREAVVEFASTWPVPHPYGPEFAARLWRADFAYEDGERGRPLAEVREEIQATATSGA